MYKLVDLTTGETIGDGKSELLFKADYFAQDWAEKNCSGLEIQLANGQKPIWTESDDMRR